MQLFGYDVTIARKAAAATRGTVAARSSSSAPPQAIDARSGGGWTGVVREPFTGAWQLNQEIRPATALAYWAVYACVNRIATDIGKLRLRLVAQDDNGIWDETSNPAYSPFLRKPNRYQTINKFVEQWITSKLVHGNAYVLKQRDDRGVVVAGYVLDPTRVTPLVAADGSVWYQLTTGDALTRLDDAAIDTVTVPAREIFHDTMICLFHPLIGVSPLFACGVSALQGLSIQQGSSKFFATGSRPGGVLTAPGAIGDDTAKRLKDYFENNFSGDNSGRVAILGDGLKYEPLTYNAVDSQLIDQLNWTAVTVCGCFGVPLFLIDSSKGAPYANSEPLVQLYYAQCLQSLITNFEATLDEGMAIAERVNGTQYGTEFDIDDLIWMDTTTRTKAAADSISAGALSPDEARKKYYGVGPVKGGDTPYMQQQMFSLAALAERDAEQPFAKPAPAAPAAPANEPPPQPPPPDDTGALLGKAAIALLEKDWARAS